MIRVKSALALVLKLLFDSMIWRALIGLAMLGAALGAPALAQELRQIEGVPVVTGGVGVDEREEMLLALPDYNLKVVTAARRSGEYLADVALEVRDATSKRVFGATLDGPWLLARLPPGGYELRVSFADRTQTTKVTVPAQGRRDAYFYWDVPPSGEPAPATR